MNDTGNIVHFGPKVEDNFILHVASNKNVFLRRKRGVYLLDVKMQNGVWKEITVDSGAADSVSPIHWGNRFPMMTDVPKRRFVTAGGKALPHHGQRTVKVRPF